MRGDGTVTEYAIGGAMALSFRADPVTTFDLDVFVTLPASGSRISLSGVYDWAKGHGYAAEHEHLMIAGTPVQVIPAHSDLVEEAIQTAATLDYDGVPVRVMLPEYLAALSLESSARSSKRIARVRSMLEDGVVDRRRLVSLAERFGLRLPEE